MADEETPETPEETPWERLSNQKVIDGGFDPRDPAAEDVTWNFDDLESDEKPMGLEAAIKRMRKRLPYSRTMMNTYREQTGQGVLSASVPATQNVLAELTRKVLAKIPQEKWTKEVIDNIDIRPLVEEIAMSPAELDDPEATEEIQGVQYSQQERAYASLILGEENQRIEKRVMDSLLAGLPEDAQKDKNHPAYIEAQNVALEVSEQYKSKSQWRTPTPAGVGETYFDQESGEFKRVPTSSATDPNDTTDVLGMAEIGTNNLTPTKFLTREEVMRLTQAGELNIDTYGSFETDPEEMRGVVDGNVPRVANRGAIQYQDPNYHEAQTPFLSGTHIGNAMGKDASTIEVETKDWYSVRDILAKPGEMNNKELMAIHEKLKSAGIYDMVGGEPTIPGDSSDPAFKAAWKMLAQMSLEKGESMVSILEDRTVAYQQELESALSVSLTDPARLRINADVYARSAIGRKLGPEEQEKLVAFLHDLERENARTAAGLEINAGETDPIPGVDEVEEGYEFDIDAQMEEWFDREKGGEVGARDIAETYDSFTRLLGGPGRGGSFG